ncbi:hypothetical protein BB558_001224 [Smittium angustum]|uniref:RRM domain-containing protein n=1 Tax=Smittium angustum TaxID=133377 RepID=A0A2U1JCD4_SMIAN|nr:hypothetical protein BB558_001224 [Smittium angustum]
MDKSLEDIIKESKKEGSLKKKEKGAAARLKKTKNESKKEDLKWRVGKKIGEDKKRRKSVLDRIGKAGKVIKKKEVKSQITTRDLDELRKKRRKEFEKKKEQEKTELKINIKGEAGPAAVFVANLDPEASSEDVKTCFKQFGHIESCMLLYNSSGNPTGNAEVVFKLKASAVEAIQKLNNVVADGRVLIVQAKGDFRAPQQPITRPPSTLQASQPKAVRSYRANTRRIQKHRMDVD